MKKLVFLFSLFILSFSASAQYWFGPKAGISYIDHVYQERSYERDSFNVSKDWNFQAGAAFNYTATGMYSVYGEIMYERIGKKLEDKFANGDFAKTEMTNHFITIPVMLRVTLGTVPFHYYVNGGPRLSYWLGGNGSFELEEFDEFPPVVDDDGNPLPVDYKLKFKSTNASPDDPFTAFVEKPNRVQFGLALGGGVYFDLATGGRLQLDFRMNWVHSNMGTNSNNDTNLVRQSYRENLEYFHNISSLSIAYLFGYDSQMKRKGKSTNKESNKKKKK
ncbi:MAG: hypothetical protein Tsb0034_23640 [Ekhidna sp.]